MHCCGLHAAILSHVFDDLKIEASKSPKVSLFVRLRNYWDKVSHTMADWTRHDASMYNVDAKSVLNSCRDAALDITRASVEYRREDYQEFANF